MSTSTHATAIFEEGFLVVSVSDDDVDYYGEQELWEAIQGHDWIVEQEVPVVLCFYDDETESIRAYGDKEIVKALSQMNYDEIVWGHELTLEWEDEEE